MVLLANSTASLYPSHWPEIPFHDGEVEIQKKLGVYEEVMSYGPRGIRPYMPDQHRDFFTNQPFLVVAARDARDRLWSTLLFASSSENVASFVESPHPQQLVMHSRPLPGDALEDAFQPGSDLGILGIEFATRRRNRVNGRVTTNSGKQISFKVDQSFGNCPQYIKPRDWWIATPSTSSPEVCLPHSPSSSPSRPNRLSLEQMRLIQNAESIFVATGYRGQGENSRFGNDASHRGGTPGFLKVSKNGKRLFLPDYAGNNFYMSIGNLIKDSRMGITIPLYETGGMLQMTGTTTIHWEDKEEHNSTSGEVSLSDFPGALRWLEFEIDEIVELSAGSLPIRWDGGKRDLQLQVVEKVEESLDVTSFYLAPLQGDSPIVASLPGQHLTVKLPISDDGTISRSYSISNYQISQKNGSIPYYRISVRRDPFGVGSTYLHDHVQAGDIVSVQQPLGDFIYKPQQETSKNIVQERTVLFLSAGIGVTPLLAMLHAFVQSKNRHKNAIWMHSARNGRQHPFQNEVGILKKQMDDIDRSDSVSQPSLQTFTAYTRPTQQDHPSSYDHHGRIDGAAALRTILAQAGINVLENIPSALDVYLCGPNSFVASMEDALNELGVGSIQYETF